MKKIITGIIAFASIALVTAAVVLTSINFYHQHHDSGPSDEYAIKVISRLADSEGAWQQQLSAPAGSTVELKVEYVNCSDKLQSNVAIWANLPEGLEYVNGTTKLHNSQTEGIASVIQDTITSDGLNIGEYSTSSGAFVFLTVRIPDTTTVGTTFTPTIRIGIDNYVNTATTTISTVAADPSPDIKDTFPTRTERDPQASAEEDNLPAGDDVAQEPPSTTDDSTPDTTNTI